MSDLEAAGYTTRYTHLAGKRGPPCKYVLISTFKRCKEDIWDSKISDDCHKWVVKLDVRDHGGGLNLTLQDKLLLLLFASVLF